MTAHLRRGASPWVPARRGSTAASSALLLQEPDVSLGQLTSRFGPAASRRIRRLSHDAVHDSGVRVEQAWEGLFAMTPDSLPYIGPHRRYPGHIFALGYGGNGMTFGFLAARMLVEMWHGVRSADHRLFAFDRMRGLQSRPARRHVLLSGPWHA